MRVMWLGTYERDYPRTRVLIDGLSARGVEVVECHRPVWERQTHKAGGFLRPMSLIAAGLRMVAPGRRCRSRRPAVGRWTWCRRLPGSTRCGAGLVVAKAKRAPLVVDMMISLADTLAGDRGVAGRGAAGVLAGIDRVTLRLADLVLATRRPARDSCTSGSACRGGASWWSRGGRAGAFRPAPPPAGPPHVLFYGKLSPLHGVATVLEAARMPGVPPVRLIGDGQLGPWLRDELRRDTPAGLRWDPWVPYENLGDEVRAAAVCLGVFGSSDKAARVVPNKVWQAMAAARPVVSADTPGIREAVTDGINGLLVPAGDAEALADALRRLAADAGLRARMGQAARATYLERGAPERVAGMLHDALTARRGA